MWRLGLYAVGILVAHAGTGMLILLICMPFVVIIHRRWDLLRSASSASPAILVFGEVLNLDFITGRAGEFDDPNSSGFARFVGGFYMFDQMLWPDLKRALFGYGAGAFMDYVHLFDIEVADMPMTKMIFEFGLVGALVYFTFIASCLFCLAAAAHVEPGDRADLPAQRHVCAVLAWPGAGPAGPDLAAARPERPGAEAGAAQAQRGPKE